MLVLFEERLIFLFQMSRAMHLRVEITQGKLQASSCYAWRRELVFGQISKLRTSFLYFSASLSTVNLCTFSKNIKVLKVLKI